MLAGRGTAEPLSSYIRVKLLIKYPNISVRIELLLNTQLFLHITSDCRASNEDGVLTFKAIMSLVLDAE